MNIRTIFGTVLLLCAALIWGVAFISTRYLSSQGFGVFFEILIRYATPFCIFGLFYNKDILKTPVEIIKKCVFTGLILFVTLVCSIYGIRLVSHGSMGLLLMSLYVILVPIATILLNKQKIPLIVALSALLSFLGTILLRLEGSPGPQNIGTLFCLLASVGYTVYIIVCSKILNNNDVAPPILQFYQSLTFLVLTIPIFLVLEMPVQPQIDFSNYKLVASLLYKGIFSGTVAYQCYFHGQKLSLPTTTAIVLASQSVFGAIADIIIFKINLSQTSIIAYIMIIVATFLVTLQPKKSIKFQD